jgi:hypothetical protein
MAALLGPTKDARQIIPTTAMQLAQMSPFVDCKEVCDRIDLQMIKTEANWIKLVQCESKHPKAAIFAKCMPTND